VWKTLGGRQADENMARQHLFCTILSTSTNALISTIKEKKFFSAPKKPSERSMGTREEKDQKRLDITNESE
jgi:hypothetical protein